MNNLPTEAEVDTLRERSVKLQAYTEALKAEALIANQRVHRAERAWYTAYDEWKAADPTDADGNSRYGN